MNSETGLLNVGALMDDRQLSRFQLQVFALCGLIMLLDGFDALCMGFLAPAIAEDLGIPLQRFGPVFAASLFGLMVASMGCGPIADRWGRKWVIVVSTLTFGSFSLLTARASSLEELVVWRFLTGLGLGGAMTNIVALASEYMPKSRQLSLVTALFMGMPLGALVGSLLSSLMIPLWGWRSVLLLGGFLPLVVAMIAIKRLPESLKFLVLKRGDSRAIPQILQRIAPELSGTTVTLTAANDDQTGEYSIKQLFTEGRAAGTVLLWIPFFMNLLIIYFIVSWLPGLLRQLGMPVSAGVLAVSVYSIGGIIGNLLQGRLMSNGRADWVLSIEFGTSAVLIAFLAFAGDSLALTLAVTMVLGICVNGAQAGLNGIAAGFYPTSIRATGVGWASGIGRIGSIIGPTVGGALLSMQWTPQQILLAATLPALGAATASLIRKNACYDRSNS
jgi:MFS transporter, AAHS family, 4-hydroxybenzoate transporter